MIPNVPTTQAVVNNQRNSLSITMDTYFQSSIIYEINVAVSVARYDKKGRWCG